VLQIFHQTAYRNSTSDVTALQSAPSFVCTARKCSIWSML